MAGAVVVASRGFRAMTGGGCLRRREWRDGWCGPVVIFIAEGNRLVLALVRCRGDRRRLMRLNCCRVREEARPPPISQNSVPAERFGRALDAPDRLGAVADRHAPYELGVALAPADGPSEGGRAQVRVRAPLMERVQ